MGCTTQSWTAFPRQSTLHSATLPGPLPSPGLSLLVPQDTEVSPAGALCNTKLSDCLVYQSNRDVRQHMLVAGHWHFGTALYCIFKSQAVQWTTNLHRITSRPYHYIPLPVPSGLCQPAHSTFCYHHYWQNDYIAGGHMLEGNSNSWRKQSMRLLSTASAQFVITSV